MSTYPIPNRYFDPQIGHQIVNRFLDELGYSDEVGLDGVVVNEHHQLGFYNAFSPSPNLIASIMTQRIKKGRIAVLGNALPLYGNPVRVAEEIAMLDVISGGRIIAGFVRGGANEYFAANINPAESRGRFEEAWDLIEKAWTERDPFAWEGKYYRPKHVSIWPRPIQQPHPPIWVPTTSGDTTPLLVKKRAATAMVFVPTSWCKPVFDKYRDLAGQEGFKPSDEYFMTLRVIYVSDSDQQAMKEATGAFDFFETKCLGSMPPGLFSIAGHTSPKGALGYLRSTSETIRHVTLETAVKDGRAIVGSPETVREQIIEQKKELGLGAMLLLFQFGNLNHEMMLRNMRMFGQDVLPKLRSV